ncbi:uncharacterized protein PHALS_05176 [Plasmopara halstedii]|uniref:DUF7802 domain-containing protein n=1 Tax=Plasmopara halstedii TaxID=4781 RepID=A0A0P1B1L9_PLAHL|nr:uncharacterized protein PHALS_05176 [Plasmopara halstedii]CEG47846.1 hypothetical protein PHALS_05176 [Plasmopara halstedii]|eukprot:XP_024584215.1 hypothetical protein PHALS_05176 [Plasmopara halstedii]
MEGATYLNFFILLLHVYSSGKRNATMLIAAILQVLIVELTFDDSDRWHAQALVMLVPSHVPLYTVLLRAQLYYMTFVATSRLRINPFLQPFAMGFLIIMLTFPFEMMGTKFLWWTWHDTDPLLHSRIMGIPCHVLFYYYFFAFAFLSVHHILCSTWLVDVKYSNVHWKSEWGYVLLMPFIATIFAMFFLILGYYGTVYFLKIDAQAMLFTLMGLSSLLAWLADRERDDTQIQKQLGPEDAYDSDWLNPSFDHAVNQMAFLLYAFLILLVLFIDPTEIVSLGLHQPLGNCLESESFYSHVGMQFHRKKYLCVHEFEEDYILCNYPVKQLLYEDMWYMICGRSYQNYPTYLMLSISSFLGINMLLIQADA